MALPFFFGKFHSGEQKFRRLEAVPLVASLWPRCFVLCLVLFVSSFGPSVPACGQQELVESPAAMSPLEGTKKILILHSYDWAFLWTRKLHEGFSAGLDQTYQYEIHTEFLGIRNQSLAQYFAALEKFLATRYQKVQFSLIFCTDDEAYSFLVERAHRLFPGVPVLFAGVSSPRGEEFRAPRGFAGLIESANVKKTLDAILQVQPDTQQILAIADSSSMGQASVRELAAAAKALRPSLRLRIVLDTVPREIQKELQQTYEHTVAMLLWSVHPHEKKEWQPRRESAELLKESHLPVYSFWGYYIGKGAVGGVITDAYAYGYRCAELAKRILLGESPDQVGVGEQVGEKYLFDYQALMRFALPENRLPRGATVINMPQSLWVRFPKVLLSLVVLFVVAGSSFFVFALMHFRRRAAEIRFAALFEHLVSGIIVGHEVCDAKGALVDILISEVNPAGERCIGLAKAQLESLLLSQIFASDFERMKPLMMRIHDALKSSQTAFFEFFFHRTGRWLSVTAFRTGGQHIAALVDDISDRKHDEQIVLQKTQRLQLLNEIIRSANTAVRQEEFLAKVLKLCVRNFDFSGGIALLTDEEKGERSLCSFFGVSESFGYYCIKNIVFESLSADSWVLVPLAGILPPSLLNETPVRFALVLNFYSKNREIGSLIFFLKEHRELAEEERDVLWGIRSEIENALLRFLSERDILRSQINLNVLFDSVDDLIFVVSEHGFIAQSNRRFSEVLGYSRDQLEHFKFTSLYPERLQAEAERFWMALKSGERSLCNLPICKANGEEMAAETIFSEGSWTGIPVFFGISRDASLRVKAENDLRKAKEIAEETSLAKSEFLANTSHEVRTPLNAVLGFSSLLLEEVQDPTMKRYLGHIYKSSEDLSQIIEDILDLSKIEAGSMALELEEFALRALLESVVERCQGWRRDARLQVSLSSGVAPLFCGAAMRLRQVLMSLVAHAFKNGEMSAVLIDVHPLEDHSDRSLLEFVVQDDGRNSQQDERSPLFSPFRSEEGASGASFAGGGLSLFVSRRLVEIMGGCFWIEKQSDRGTTVHFTLTLKKPPQLTSC